MKFNYYGFFGFFLLSSFKGHVEPHWTAIGFIPLIILSYHSMESNQKAIKWMKAAAKQGDEEAVRRLDGLYKRSVS